MALQTEIQKTDLEKYAGVCEKGLEYSQEVITFAHASPKVKRSVSKGYGRGCSSFSTEAEMVDTINVNYGAMRCQ